MVRAPHLISLAGFLAAAAPAAAHPHVFVDTGLRVQVDERGRVTGIEVSWEYDELYSMLNFQDLGLDPDYDGVLTEDELAALDGFDLHWVPGYEGDLYAETSAGPVALGPPQGRGVRVEAGRIRSTHFRPLAAPVAAAGLVLRAYDPSFYTFYTLDLGVEVAGGCRAEVVPPDLDEADRRLKVRLAAIPAEQTETDFPAVGATFADTVTIRCGG